MKGVPIMEVAKITSRGQITIPIDVRKKLGLKEGDKVIFIEEGNNIIFANAARVAFRNMQEVFEGEAERLGLKDEQDVVDLVDEVRQEMWDKRYANND
jgi:AbrB family looped-hinge helix DNA binding protein